MGKGAVIRRLLLVPPTLLGVAVVVFVLLRVVPGDPVAMPTRDVGMVLRSDQLYVRDAIDAAIAELAADGTLQRIYEEVGFPGTVPR